MVIHHIRNGSALGFAALGSFFALLPSPAQESVGFDVPVAISLLLGIALFSLAYILKTHPKVNA